MKVFARILIIIIVLGGIGGLAYYKYINTVTFYNEGEVNGNTISNLYGKGLFCEKNGVVYFANPNDSDRLYKMNPDESDIEYIANDSVYYLNADDHYLYYSRNGEKYRDNSQLGFLNVNTDSLCRMSLRNGKVLILDDAICNACALGGNTIVYFHYDPEEATTLYSVKIDGKERQQINNTQIDPRCLVGEKLYYSGVENDHNLHNLNIHSKDSKFISSQNLWMPTVVGSEVYYMNLDENNRVYKSPLGSDEKTAITSYGTSDYNVAGNYLYYQTIKGNPDGLYRVDLSSGSEILLKEGQFNNINVTSQYVYFADFFSGRTFHSKIGSTNVSIFDPPIESVEEQ